MWAWKGDGFVLGFVAVDVETASSRSQGYICSIGVCVIRDGRVVEEFYTLCHPGIAMDPFCQNIHGITDEMVEGAPTTYEMLEKVAPYLEGQTVVAHNAPFDVKQIREAAERVGFSLPAFDHCCTVQLSRKVFPNRPSYRLGALVDLIGFPFTAHNALADARACAALFLACRAELERHPAPRHPNRKRKNKHAANRENR